MTFLGTKMCSVVLQPRLKPACSSLISTSSTASCSLVIIALPMTFAGTDHNVIPRQLPQSERFPFLGCLTIRPKFQSSGSSSVSHTVRNRSSRNARSRLYVTLHSLSSVVIVSFPAAFPFFMFFRACFISCLVIDSSLTFIFCGRRCTWSSLPHTPLNFPIPCSLLGFPCKCICTFSFVRSQTFLYYLVLLLVLYFRSFSFSF